MSWTSRYILILEEKFGLYPGDYIPSDIKEAAIKILNKDKK